MKNSKKKILVTGSAGFIGMHTAIQLANYGYDVIGIDNLNSYYSVDLKLARLREQGISTNQIEYNRMLSGKKNIRFKQLELEDDHSLDQLFASEHFDYVVHLAAQAGVRYSIENPRAYINANIKGFLNILELGVLYKIKHIVYASSSSVYGLNEKTPFSETDQTDNQVSLYAATKKANEVMAHSYAAVHKLPLTGLRFFTVYGPYGRPDMALFKFTKRILQDLPIDVYNHGQLSRDFTYIDDIVNGITGILSQTPKAYPPAEIFNIGRGEPVALNDFIEALEVAIGKKARRNNMPMQAGDVKQTFANTKKLYEMIDYKPQTTLREGVASFVEWYCSFYS